jgi:two-component system cell cycle response regulator DivK
MPGDTEVPPLVLLVDDNPDSLNLYAAVLRQKGFRVDTAANGAEALSQAAASTPDVIVMDLAMPVLDGWEATRRLREGATTRDIPIIVLTAHSNPVERRRAEEAGCDAFLTKPFPPSSLEATVRMMLRRTPS